MPLAIVSNWPYTLAETLGRAGLHHYFKVVISSGDAGYAKPHAAIFRAAVDRLGVPPARALYVGDSVEHDFHGAAKAGMPAVLLDRDNSHPALAPRVASLAELPALLGLE